MAGQDDARSTKFSLFSPLAGELSPMAIGEIASVRKTANRPDNTTRVTDTSEPQEVEITFRKRDKLQLAALKAWRGSREHASCVLTYLTEKEEVVDVVELVAMCPRDWKASALAIGEDPEEVVEVWTFVYDDAFKLNG